jgi:Spy/CpxP family protein refolding chaperone
MFKVQKLIPAAFLAASLSGLAMYAATTTPAAAEGGHWHRHHHGLMGGVLHKLNLTEAQKTQIKSIMTSEKSQFQALRTSSQTNREALESTPPTSSGYAALIATAQKNAATRVQLMSETWKSIYQNVLTPAQQEQIPAIVAAQQAKMKAWQAEHQSSTSSSTAQ